MRNVKEVGEKVLGAPGEYTEVHAEGVTRRTPPSEGKGGVGGGQALHRTLHSRQARKDARDREAIIELLKEQLKRGAKAMIGTKATSNSSKMESGSISVDVEKIEEEAKHDGITVLRTNTALSPKNVALRYKDLWMVERASGT